MCPLDPKYLARVTGGLPIEDDRFCTHCGYNLIGMKTSQRCPECGHFIDENTFGRLGPERKLLIVHDPGPFGASPASYQAALARWTYALGASGLAMILVFPLSLLRPGPVSGSLATLASLAWFISSWMITRDRRVARGSKVDTRTESAGLRAWARSLQILWLFVAAQLLLAGLPIEGVARHSTRLVSMAWFTLPAAMACLFPLVWHVSALGFWVGDTSLAFYMRTMTWVAIPGAVVAFALTFTRALPASLHAWGLSSIPVEVAGGGGTKDSALWVPLATAAHALALAPLALLGVACFDLVLMSAGIRRAIRERADDGPAFSPIPTPSDTPVVELADAEDGVRDIRPLNKDPVRARPTITPTPSSIHPRPDKDRPFPPGGL